jgi:GntR family transcriptional regulator
MDEPDDPLLLRLDDRRGVPLFRQVVDAIRYAASSGRLLPGDRLPSVRGLAARLGVNPATVQKAYRELDLRGLVSARRGQGTFVAKATTELAESERIATLWDEIQVVLATARELDIDRDELLDLFVQGLDDTYADEEPEDEDQPGEDAAEQERDEDEAVEDADEPEVGPGDP